MPDTNQGYDIMTKTHLIRIFPTIVLLFTVNVLSWSADLKCLVVRLQNGSEQIYELYKKPELTFNNHTLRIYFEGRNTDLEISSVSWFTFEIKNDIEEISVNKDNLKIVYLSEDKIMIEGVGENAHVGLFSINGMNYSNCVSIEDGNALVSLASLPKGAYIIKASNNQSFKIYKK